MTISAGTAVYNLGSAPVMGAGLSWSDEELDEAIEADVAGVVFDAEGTADVEQLLAEIADTEFQHDAIARVLETKAEVEDWRVGEAIAEEYLKQHRQCAFPWPDGRDERKSGSSLPGADLVGLRESGGSERFAFGEVKTSSEAKYPPQAMYGRTGLKKQLEDLRDREDIRDQLVKYLGFRARGAAWEGRYRAASRRYLADSYDVILFGVLVRDVDPDENDLSARVENLAEACPGVVEIELLAIYLPAGRIPTLATKAIAVKGGGAA